MDSDKLSQTEPSAGFTLPLYMHQKQVREWNVRPITDTSLTLLLGSYVDVRAWEQSTDTASSPVHTTSGETIRARKRKDDEEDDEDDEAKE